MVRYGVCGAVIRSKTKRYRLRQMILMAFRTGGEQDYFNFQPDNKIGVGFPQANADLDQSLPDLSLERLDDLLNFITPTENPWGIIDQFT